MIRVQSKPKESAQLAFDFPRFKPQQLPPIARRLTNPNAPRRIKRDRSTGA